ncbi:CD3072 family TudS-related putative desulfidase [Clostridium sp. Marseille-QA1073]
MKRSKKICLVTHCILNGNAKVEGLCNYKGAVKEVVEFLMNKDFGIIQLPCPEINLYGIKRWGHVKEQFNTPYFRENCTSLLKPIINQIEDYKNNGYEIALVLGIDGSPSCGINYTCSSKKWSGELSGNENLSKILKDISTIKSPGVFMEIFRKNLESIGVNPIYLTLNESNVESSIEAIKNYL